MCFEHLTLHSAVFGLQIAGALLFLQHLNSMLNSKIRVALIKAKKKVSRLRDDPIETGNTVRREFS